MLRRISRYKPRYDRNNPRYESSFEDKSEKQENEPGTAEERQRQETEKPLDKAESSA